VTFSISSSGSASSSKSLADMPWKKSSYLYASHPDLSGSNEQVSSTSISIPTEAASGITTRPASNPMMCGTPLTLIQSGSAAPGAAVVCGQRIVDNAPAPALDKPSSLREAEVLSRPAQGWGTDASSLAAKSVRSENSKPTFPSEVVSNIGVCPSSAAAGRLDIFWPRSIGRGRARDTERRLVELLRSWSAQSGGGGGINILGGDSPMRSGRFLRSSRGCCRTLVSNISISFMQ
jgi:hypothetical protein